MMFTPGPWRWEVNETAKKVELCGGDPKGGYGKYDLTVMCFARWGMSGTKPVFADAEKHILSGCENYLEIVPSREHHAKWFKTINHPDANLIAAAPDLLAALQKIAAIENREFGPDWEEIEEARQIANEAIRLVTGEG